MSEADKSRVRLPERPGLSNRAMWDRNLALMGILLTEGTVTEWLDSNENTRVEPGTCLPYKFAIDGQPVEFLPHWGGYAICGLWLGVLPKTSEELHDAVARVAAILPLQPVMKRA